MAHHGTSRREQALAALLESANVLEASQVCGVPRRTMYRWLAEADFKQALERAKHDLVTSCINRLRLASGSAVSTLREIMCDQAQPASARCSCAKAVITLTLEASELQSIRERLDELERKTVNPNWSSAS
jgi:hypothetical protein